MLRRVLAEPGRVFSFSALEVCQVGGFYAASPLQL